ncbi:hypothetical protein [Halorientalis pallida]|uniref:Uncharacterized protein n=1 Tax=Halorientalis pallida TaxID=2479928 RepID=A0A498L230_9EURY|nr:hypothetical protein [Halorientalis pallida]RXK50186.1 hypothetical protein EAF64_06395 [Halorientalis pallida]
MHDAPRRRVLRTGGTLLAGGLTVGLGGCLQSDGTDTPTDDSDDDGDDGGGGGGSLPAFADWLPAPAAMGTDHYEFTAADPSAIFEHESAVEGSAFGGLTGATEQLDGITLSDLSGLYLIGGGMVLTGDVDADAFRSFLAATGYAEGETYHGYTFYTGGPGGTAAVSSDTAIRAGTLGDAREKIEAIIDAKQGTADRYTDANPDCRTLLSRLGSGAVAGGRTHEEAAFLDGVVADGFRWRLDGTTASFTGAFVFESQSAVDTAAVESLVAERAVFDPLSSPSVSAAGRTAVVDGTADTGSVSRLGPRYGAAGGPGGRGDRPPQVSFSWDYERRGDGVGITTVSHDGGDSVRASELVFRGDGFVGAGSTPETVAGELDVTESGGQWPAAFASGNVDGDAAVVAGDQARLGVASDAEISLVWESADSDVSATLSAYEGPDA